MPAVLLENTNPDAQLAVQEAEVTDEEIGYTHAAAFMVLIDLDGNYIFEPNINAPVVTKRKPTASEIKGSLATILADIQSQDTAMLAANFTIGGMMQQAMAMREQSANQEIAQKLRLR